MRYLKPNMELEFLAEKTPWQWPIFPRRLQRSIVSAETFHYRVRDGNGWFRIACTTKGLKCYIVISAFSRS